MLDNNLIANITATAAGASEIFDTETVYPGNVQSLYIEGYAASAVTAGDVTVTLECSDDNSTFIKVYEGTVDGDLTDEENLFIADDMDIKGFTFPTGVTTRYIKITVTSADSDPGQIEYEFRLQKVLIY